MGVADVTSKVLLEFRADTRSARKEIKNLSGEQKKAAKVAIVGMEKQNKALDNQIATLAKVAVGVGAVVGAYAVLSRSATAYAKRQQQIAASARVDFEKIADATTNLVTETQALDLAARTAGGTFKATQEQMELAARAAVVLAQQQGTLEQSLEAVAQALQEGNIEPLKKYGLVVKDIENDTIQGFNAALGLMTEVLDENGDAFSRAGTDAQRMGNKIEDVKDRVTNALGEFAVNIAKAFEDDPFDTVTRQAQFADQVFRQAITNALILATLRNLTPEQLAARRAAIALSLAGRGGAAAGAGGGLAFEDIGTLPALDIGGGGRRGGRGRGRGGATVTGPAGGPQIGRGALSTTSLGFAAGGAGLGEVGGTGQFGAGGALGVLTPEVAEQAKSSAEIVAEGLRDVRTEAEMLADAMLITGTAVLGGFEAWGQGAIGLGEAMKQALGNAIGDILMGEAQKHLALAVADAITLNPRAGLHLAAAAGLAAASGKVRSFLGGSGGGASAGGGGGGRAPGASAGGFGGGGGGTNSEQIFVVEIPFSDSPRKRRKDISDALERTRNQQGRGGTVERR